MMLTFALVPQTSLVTGFKPTVNPVEKPSSQSPTPINQRPSADTFTPSAVKSRAGGNATEALAALEEALRGYSQSHETEQALQQIRFYIEHSQGREIVSDALMHLKAIPNQSTKLKQALKTLEVALEDLLPKSEADRGQATASFNLDSPSSSNGSLRDLYKKTISNRGRRT